MTPKTETELADAIASAKTPLRIIGGGTRPIGTPVAGEVLSTAALSGIELYEPGAQTPMSAAPAAFKPALAAIICLACALSMARARFSKTAGA